MYEELVTSLRTDHDKYFARDMEAADAIEELSTSAQNGEAAYSIMVSLTNYVEELKQKIPNWIPVTERLPGLREDVQILFPNNQAVGFYDGFDWCIYTGDDYFSVVMEDEVKPTHWAKKLPEPPKEE